MNYNKTKRGLEKGAGILGVVLSSIDIIASLTIMILGFCFINSEISYLDSELGQYVTLNLSSLSASFISAGIIELTLSILTLIFSAKVIKSPVTENGVLNTTNIRICLIVFAALSGQWITLGLMIAVVCLKDFKSEKSKYVQPQINSEQFSVKSASNMTIDEKVKELKHLKDLGVIDETIYKNAIKKLWDEIM